MRKFLQRMLLMILCMAMCVLAAACSGTPDTPDDPDDPNTSVTLKIQSAAPLKQNYLSLLRSEPEGSQLYNQALFTKRLVEGFKELCPNVTLNFIEDGWGDALYQKQQLYIRDFNAGGKMAVDIMIGETYMGYFAENNVFLPLDQSKFNVVEGVYADTVVNGEMYCVPMCTGICGLQYNTQILTEVGIPEDKWVPATWDELLENCRIVSEYAAAHPVNGKIPYGGIIMNNVSGMSSAFRALPFMRSAGGDFLNENGELIVDSEENLEAFTYLRKLAQYAYADSLTQGSEDTLQYYFINNGYGAYMIEGQWPMASAGEHIKSAPLPAAKEGETAGNTYMSSVMFGIVRGTRYQNEAQKFLEYLTSAEVQQWFYELDGRLPVNKEILASEEIRTVHPNINSYIDVLEAGNIPGSLAAFTKNVNDIWTRWGSFYSDVLTSDKDIATELKSLSDFIKGKM